MLIAVPKEIKDGEKRVALVPDVISKLTRLGLDVSIESGAGTHSQGADADYESAGAKVVNGDVLKSADVVLSVQPLTPAQMSTLKKGAITISFLSPTTAVDSIDAAAKAGVTAFSLELVPRISRAQSMDALTSQALCAGYRAALVGAELSPRFFPMLMTAAGTVTPAQVLVLGAGVAGLQLRVDSVQLSLHTMFVLLLQMKSVRWVQHLLNSNSKLLKVLVVTHVR
jgi:NAD(P) transhydrogenase subunit alpha